MHGQNATKNGGIKSQNQREINFCHFMNWRLLKFGGIRSFPPLSNVAASKIEGKCQL